MPASLKIPDILTYLFISFGKAMIALYSIGIALNVIQLCAMTAFQIGLAGEVFGYYAEIISCINVIRLNEDVRQCFLFLDASSRVSVRRLVRRSVILL